MCSTEGIRSKSPLMTLPNELFLEVASHLKSFKDLNSLVRTSRRFHTMFNTDLYRRAVAAPDIVLYYIVRCVLSAYQLASLTLLLDNGLPVNYKCTRKYGHAVFRCDESMLYFLCRRKDQERSVPLARLLLQRGADMDWNGDSFSDSVLFTAIRSRNYQIAALLLIHGADVNAAEDDQRRALHIAIACAMDSYEDNPEMVHLLIAHGADIEARCDCGDTPLIVSSEGNPRIMAALLEHGADAGVHNDIGETPLHHASTWFGSEHHNQTGRTSTAALATRI
jgi:hypothetical protein